MTDIDLSGLIYLREMDCGDNESTQLTSLNLSGCSAMLYLDCSHNQLNSLDLSGCTFLDVLMCFENQLTTLDVSYCYRLLEVNCADNPLTELFINKDAPISLEMTGTRIQKFDFCDNTKLSDIVCEFTTTSNDDYWLFSFSDFKNAYHLDGDITTRDMEVAYWRDFERDKKTGFMLISVRIRSWILLQANASCVSQSTWPKRRNGLSGRYASATGSLQEKNSHSSCSPSLNLWIMTHRYKLHPPSSRQHHSPTAEQVRPTHTPSPRRVIHL